MFISADIALVWSCLHASSVLYHGWIIAGNKDGFSSVIDDSGSNKAIYFQTNGGFIEDYFCCLGKLTYFG